MGRKQGWKLGILSVLTFSMGCTVYFQVILQNNGINLLTCTSSLTVDLMCINCMCMRINPIEFNLSFQKMCR